MAIHDLAKGLDDGWQIDAVLLDFSKAFDKMPHQRLLHKLSLYGVRGDILKWISAFLSNRTQSVLCEGPTLFPQSVISGVPYGTVLGPLLFLAYTYIDDLTLAASSSVRLFADDWLCTDVSIPLQSDLNNLQKWEPRWQFLILINARYYALLWTRKTLFVLIIPSISFILNQTTRVHTRL